MSNGIESELVRSLVLFQAAIDQTDNLEIICCESKEDGSGDVLVVENSNLSKEDEGHQSTVDVAEIFAKCKDEKAAQRFAGVINCTEKPIVCEGVTRIVGYYSRVQNWNKSKVGELRDRQEGLYGTGKHERQFGKEALATVNAL